MAHQFTSGVFLHNKPAWHRLGVVVDGSLPAREAFRVAKADFQVSGKPIYDADMNRIPGYQAITRLDTGSALSVMTETYMPIQNEALIRIAEALHEDTSMDAVCVLANGRRVTFTARIKGAEAEVSPGDPIRQYLIGCTSHDGSIPFQLLFSPIRVVCQNTLSAALGMAAHSSRNNASISIRHTKNAETLLARLPEIISVRKHQFLAGLDELRHMASTPCTEVQFRHYISRVFESQLSGMVNQHRGDKNTSRKRVLEDLPAWPSLQERFHGCSIGSDIRDTVGTAYGAYQAITEHLSHDSSRCRDRVEAARRRFESLYWGTRSEQIRKAHILAMSMS